MTPTTNTFQYRTLEIKLIPIFYWNLKDFNNAWNISISDVLGRVGFHNLKGNEKQLTSGRHDRSASAVSSHRPAPFLSASLAIGSNFAAEEFSIFEEVVSLLPSFVRSLSFVASEEPKCRSLIFGFEHRKYNFLYFHLWNLKPRHTTGASARCSVRQNGGAGQGPSTRKHQRNGSPRRLLFLVPSKASNTYILNVALGARTSEILYKLVQKQTRIGPAFDSRFIK